MVKTVDFKWDKIIIKHIIKLVIKEQRKASVDKG